MNPAEIRLAFYAVLVLVLVAVGFYFGDRHVTAQWNAAKVAQDKALQTQQQQVIDLQKQRDQLQQQVEQSHAQLLANGKSLSDSVAGSLSNIEATVRSGALSRTVANPGSVQKPQQCPAIDPSLADSIESVGSAIKSLTVACVNVDADRTSIIALEPLAPH